MTGKQRFYFLGVWMIPICIALWLLVTAVYGHGRSDTPSEVLGGIALCSLPWMVLLARNIYDYFRYQQQDFMPQGQYAKWIKSISKQKRNVLYPIPEKQFRKKHPSGMVLGKWGDDYICMQLTDHNIVHGLILGPPGTGKSSGPILCTLLNTDCSGASEITYFVVDIKGELSRKSARIYNNPAVKVINPADRGTCGWDPYYGITQASNDDEIIETLNTIANALITDNNEKNAFFVNQARKIFKGTLLYFFRKQVWITDNQVHSGFVDAVLEVEGNDAVDLMKRILDDEEICSQHRKIREFLAGFLSSESEALNGIKLQLQEHLEIFMNDDVRWMLSDNPSKASPLDLNQRVNIFLSIPEEKLSLMETLFKMIVFQTLSEMEKRPEDSNIVQMILDEFPRLGRIEKLAEHSLPTLRSRHVSILLAVQDYSQLERIYGDKDARSIMNLCEITINLCNKDTVCGKILSDWTGDFREETISQGRNSLSKVSNAYENVSTIYRPIVTVHDMQSLPERGEIMLWIQGHYMCVKRLRYFEDPELSRRSLAAQTYNREHQKEAGDGFFFDEKQNHFDKEPEGDDMYEW